MRPCRLPLPLGLTASGLSVDDTLLHARSPWFAGPASFLGPRHANDYAFWKFALAVGGAA